MKSVSNRWAAIIFLCFLGLAGKAGEIYGVAGGGLSFFDKRGDGLWRQEGGWPYSIDQWDGNASIGAGYRHNKLLSLEAQYIYFGKERSYAEWGLSDEDYINSGRCADGTCGPATTHAHMNGQAQGVELSILFHAKSIYLRTGLGYVWSYWRVKTEEGENLNFVEHKQEWLIGLGANIGKRWRAEISHHDALGSGFDGIETITFGYMFH